MFYVLFILFMKKIVLKNGLVLTVVKAKKEAPCSLAITVGVGHLNEPALGLAAVCESVLLQQLENATAIQGGTITSFLTGGFQKDFESLLKKASDVLKNPDLSQSLIDNAAADIVQHTRDLAPLPERQWKLFYKHLAFGNSKLVWDTDAYIASVQSFKTEDLEALIDTYFTGKNLVVGVSSSLPLKDVRALAEQYLGDIPAGKKQNFERVEYTGGFGELPMIGNYQTIALGWDVSNLYNVAEANVLMSMLSGRLERSLAGTEATREVKIAGYYGARTLRVSIVLKNGEDINPYIDILCANIVRLKNTLASDRRMETSRQRAASEKLAQFSQPQDAAVEAAWQELGRAGMYDIDERINATFLVSARNVREIAQDIFTSAPTIVVSGEGHYDEEEIRAKLA